jgi:hypothetical protein
VGNNRRNLSNSFLFSENILWENGLNVEEAIDKVLDLFEIESLVGTELNVEEARDKVLQSSEM